MQNLISFIKCAIGFDISPTIIVLFQFQKKNPKNPQKIQNLENGESDEKSTQKKKDVEFDFTSDMIHKISRIHINPVVHLACVFSSHFPKNSQYLINGESDQKSALNKRDVEFNFLYGVCYQI